MALFVTVLKLASNFVTFFEKLTKIVERLGAELPQYRLIEKWCLNMPSDKLQESACKVYIDIFQFFQSVVRVFTKEDGSKKDVYLHIIMSLT